MLFGFPVGFFETTVGVFSLPASIALCIAVRNARPFSLASCAMTVPRGEALPSFPSLCSVWEHRPRALRFGKALWSVHQDRLLVARPSQSRGIGSKYFSWTAHN